MSDEARTRPVPSDLEHASDRATALVGAAYLEEHLADAIKARLVPNLGSIKPKILKDSYRLEKRLFAGYGPLSTFSAKIDLAHALGMLDDDAYHDLHVIRSIRNRFAHSASQIRFASPEIAQECDALRDPPVPGSQGPSTARDQYVFAVIGIWGVLGDYINGERSPGTEAD